MKTTRNITISALIFAVVSALALHLWHDQVTGILDAFGVGVELFLTKPLFHLANKPVRVSFVFKTLVFMFLLNLIARIVKRGVEGGLERNPRIDRHRKYLLSRGVTVAVYVVGLAVGIRVEKIDLTTLAIVGGTLGVVVGAGLQGVMSNFIAGLTLLFARSVRVGDRVELGGRSGDIVRLGMRSSSIRTDDNLLIILPNSEFVTKPFSNLTASGPKLRTSIFIPVAHKANPQDVIRILLEIADGHPDVLKSPAPSVILAELRPHAAMFTLLVWTKIVPADFAILRSGLNLAVADRFRQANIELPRAYMGPVEVGLEPVCGVH